MVLGDGIEKSGENPTIQKARVLIVYILQMIRDQMRERIADKEKFF